MINITFYYYQGDNIVLNKEFFLKKSLEVQGYFKQSINILYPVINIELEKIPDFNYCYIKELNRYYYITSIIISRNNLYEIYCSEDVLMSYKDIILEQKGIVNRNEFKFNKFLMDREILVESKPEIEIDILKNSPLLLPTNNTVFKPNPYNMIVTWIG